MELMTPEVRWDHNGDELIATTKIQNLKQQKTKNILNLRIC